MLKVAGAELYRGQQKAEEERPMDAAGFPKAATFHSLQ